MSKLNVFIITILVSFNSYAGLRFATYNIRTFDIPRLPTDKVELKRILSKVRPDFLTVQEIINVNSFKDFIKKNYKRTYGVHLSRCGGGGRQKIGFVYKKSKFKLKQIYEDNRLSDPGNVVGDFGCGRLRPALIGNFIEKATMREFVVIGIHLKAGGSPNNYVKRARQYEIISRIVDELRLADYENIMLMGDFNSTGYVAKDEDFSNFENMLKNLSMKTSSKRLACTSYWSGQDRGDGIEESSVLDHILFPNGFLGYASTRVKLYSHCMEARCASVSSEELGTSYGNVSDHCPVSVNFN